MDELRAELDALAALLGTFMDDSIKLLDQAIDTLDRLNAQIAEDDQCPWRRVQVRSAHGTMTDYGRACYLTDGHIGPHRTPPQAKQADSGVWYNPETGDTRTQ